MQIRMGLVGGLAASLACWTVMTTAGCGGDSATDDSGGGAVPDAGGAAIADGGSDTGVLTGKADTGGATGTETGAEDTGGATGTEPECAAAEDCTNMGVLAACTAPACIGGECAAANRPNGTICEPDAADACVVGGACQAGQCVAQMKVCDDSDACTDDSCDPADGACVHTAVEGCGAECKVDPDCPSEGLAACQLPACAEGKCGSKADFDGADCSAGMAPDPCTAAGVCDAGACKPVPTDCDDGVACTTDSCVAGEGCAHVEATPGCAETECAEDAECVDKLALSGCKVARCVAGLCEAGAAEDGSACFHPDWEANGCIEGGTCDAGNCVPQQKGCDDALDCTTDSCDPGLGACVHEPNGQDCGGTCKSDDECPDGSYCDGGLVPFIGGKVCTPKKEDGAGCTGHGQCASGACGGCLNGQSIAAGWCFTPGGKGTDEPCKADAECTTGSCTAGCPLPTTGKCECKADEQCAEGYYCAKGSFGGIQANQCLPKKGECQSCDADNMCQSGKCADTGFLGLGKGACVTEGAIESGVGPCCDDAQCQSGICQDAKCVQCTNDSDCDGGFCAADGSCSGQLALGESCSANKQCVTGQCEGGECVCGTDEDCTDGYCSAILGVKNACKAFTDECGTCTSSTECGPDATCLTFGFPISTPKCVVKDSKATGEACCKNAQCTSGTCSKKVCE